MARMTQQQVKAAIEELSQIRDAIELNRSKLNAALEPHIEAHNEAVKPVLAKYEPKIAKLEAEYAGLESAITEWLAGQGKPVVIETEYGIAANEVKQSARRIDVKRFFEAARSKGEAMWDCVTIAVAKAERLLGKTEIDSISTTESKMVPTVRLK